MQTVRSLWAWFAIGVLTVVWIPIMAIVSVLDREPGRYRTGRWFRRLGAAMSRANPAWKVRISGTLPENPRAPYVIVSNHQSNADIPVISRLPWDMKWVAKDAMFTVPVIGWMMRISQDIPVDRTDRMSRAKVLVHAKNRLEDRVSVMFMPEGTRSKDGRVRGFNDGAFRLAIRTGTSVLPLAVDGTTNALPKKSWRFGNAPNVRVHVFEPVSVEGLGVEDIEALRIRVREQIVAHIAEWRGVPVESVDALGDDPRGAAGNALTGAAAEAFPGTATDSPPAADATPHSAAAESLPGTGTDTPPGATRL